MQVVAGWADVDDVDGFLDRLAEVAATHGSVVQAVDARYVAGAEHLRRAATLARRAIDDCETIADDPGMELLLYVAGTRQIQRALEIGVGTGRQPVAIVVDGGDEDAAAADLESLVESDRDVLAPDANRVTDWYGITQAELDATDASLEELVCERVALLVLEA